MKLCCKTKGANRPTRIAYDQGVLEIRMPGEPHEIVNRLLAKIITMLAMELGMEANDFGFFSQQNVNIGDSSLNPVSQEP